MHIECMVMHDVQNESLVFLYQLGTLSPLPSGEKEVSQTPHLPCGFGAPVGVSYFPVRHSAHLHGDPFVSFPDSCVSLPRIYLRVQFLGLLTRRVTGLTLCPPPRSSRTLSFALTYSPDSLILMLPALDIVWRCPCLPRLRLL